MLLSVLNMPDEPCHQRLNVGSGCQYWINRLSEKSPCVIGSWFGMSTAVYRGLVPLFSRHGDIWS